MLTVHFKNKKEFYEQIAIAQGFKECMRVLKSGGFLIFKWNECQIRVNEVLKLMDTTPLFGNRRGDTHWLVFTKEECQNEEIS